jgi:hypothetical protein
VVQDRIISAQTEGVNYKSEQNSPPEEQIGRLQTLVAYLLEKNEQLRHIIASQNERLPPG